MFTVIIDEHRNTDVTGSRSLLSVVISLYISPLFLSQSLIFLLLPHFQIIHLNLCLVFEFPRARKWAAFGGIKRKKISSAHHWLFIGTPFLTLFYI